MTVLLEGGAEVGGYRVERVLGRGAMGVVYEAVQMSLHRSVALKVLPVLPVDPAVRERFRREAEMQAGLDHPNVVAVYEAGEAPEGLYIAMQLVRGGTLREAIEDGMEPGRAIGLLTPIAGALDAAHAAGLVHRDVKPHNILLDGGDRALLADFGLVRALTGSSLTESGGFLGTPDYVAPEQVRGRAPSPASDVYALATVLYQCLTGSVVFPVDTIDAALYAHVHEPPLPPSARRSGLPAALDDVLARGLAKDPEVRTQSAGELLAAARAALGPSATAAGATMSSGAARRLVSVLCAQLEAGGDPEVFHVAVARWAERAAEVAQRHGGVAQPATGEDFVAVFGADRLHEDDALRALRAAEELRGDAVRIGIDSGLVFLEHGVTGAAMRSAAKLAQRAQPGEIALGRGARELLRGRTDAGVPARTPFVGRTAELARLQELAARSRERPGCELVTVVGPAGMGKSRLARELVERVRPESLVLIGRCPAYGEGLAYRPLAEMLQQLPVQAGAPAGSDELRILTAAGAGGAPARPEETAWSVRRLLERLATERPVVAVFEDIHWAQPALLDLIDHVTAFSSGAPLALVCLARPDLLETRPAWATPQPNRSLVVLEPLSAEDAGALATQSGSADPARVAAIVETAEGNPLFLEQLLTVEGGALPPTVQALLAARIDALAPAERDVLERASVIGRSFPVAALDEARPPVAELHALVRKQLLAPDRPRGPGEDAFRFAHALIRDAAYEGIARRRRAALHEQAAAFVAQRRGDPDRDALAGRHLEAAYRHLAELGEPDRELALRAVSHLQPAAEAARLRGDLHSAIGLLERALSLAPDDGAVQERLGAALLDAGRFDDARRILEAVAREQAEHAPALAARARVELGFLELHADAGANDPALRTAEEALAALEEQDDLAGQSRARQLIAFARWNQSRLAAADAELRRAADLARAAGDEQARFEILAWSAGAAGFGPLPVPEAIARCDEIRAQVRSSPFTVALVDGVVALLHAYIGDFARARELSASATTTLEDVEGMRNSVAHQQALAETVAEDYARAERRLRDDLAGLEAMGEQALRSTTAAFLARVVLEQGRDDEADALAEEARRLGSPDDEATQSLWRLVRARVLARRGEAGQAEALADAALALLAPTDVLVEQAYAHEVLADVLAAAGRAADAEKAQQRAVELYDRKGATVLADRARRRLSALQEEETR